MSYPAGPPTPPPHQPGAPYGGAAVCVRHPDRATGLSCTRCGRPSCAECLREASVGYHCVDCLSESRQDAHRAAPTRTTVAGARPGANLLVVPALIGLNVALYVWTVIQAGDPISNATSTLFREWALVPGYVQAGEWWRVLTSGFMHIGVIHLLVNMVALWVLGRDLELVLGRSRFLSVYLVSLLGGSAAVLFVYQPNQAVAGASAAVFGLMGGLAVVSHRLRVPVGPVVGWIVANIAISVLIPGISLVGHLGGLVVGTAVTAALVYAPAQNRLLVQYGTIAGSTVVLALLITAAAAT